MDYLKLVRLLTKYPLRVVRNLNKENVAKYRQAIRTEHPRQILRNMERYLTNNHLSVNPAQEKDLSERIDAFVTTVRDQVSQNPQPIFLFVSHEATLTGAPLIIQKVAEHFQNRQQAFPVFLLLKGGQIQDLFHSAFPTYQLPNQSTEYEKASELRNLLDALTAEVSIDCVIVNSAESRFTLPLLRKADIPRIISLVHEMGNLYPNKSWRIISRYSDHTVFPCAFVQEKANENCTFHPSLTSVRGQGLLKPAIFDANYPASRKFVRKELGIPENAKIVLSCGTPIARKGIDIFVFTAISALSQWQDSTPLYFLWIGDAPDNYYQQWSRRDIDQSGYADHILWIDSQDDTVPWFAGSDLFFLTSRGDPFPCVVHEALAAGLQVVGFKNAGGLPEMLPPQAAVLQSYGDLASTSKDIITCLKNQDPARRESIIKYAKENLDYSMYSDYLYQLATNNEDFNGLQELRRLNGRPLSVELPVPPPAFMHYGEAPEAHLAMGKKEVENIGLCLQQSGYDVDTFHRVLEFGCNNCRLLRWFYDEEKPRELWGCDVHERAIQWCKENLGEVMHFMHNDHTPELAFEDHYFDLVFAGSIFTHIDDNDTTWLQELARITKPGGLLYLTFIDEKSIETLADEPGRFVYNKVSNHPDAPQIWEGSFEKVAIYNTKDAKRVGSPLVLSHSTYIKSMCPEELEIIQVMEKAFANFQTAYLLRKNIREIVKP